MTAMSAGLLTTAQVAEIAGRDITTIHRWARGGTLRIAGKAPRSANLFDRADVATLIESFQDLDITGSIPGIGQRGLASRLTDNAVRVGTGCLRWTGRLNGNGYGVIGLAGHIQFVHRIAYELWIGPIPDGLTVDHVKARGCVYKDCIEPAHLEAVTLVENIRRAHPQRSHCKHGHAMSGDNVIVRASGGRRCAACVHEHNRMGSGGRPQQDGGLKWCRRWYGEHLYRGAAVRVDGARARVLSARGGLLAVRLWSSGERILVRPTEAVPA